MDNLNLIKVKKKVYQSLKKTGCNNFLLAISGGSDSLFLLKMIHELSNQYNYYIRAIHVNHNFSPNSGDMENYCVNACKEYDVELVIKNLNCNTKSNIEDHLRNQRYREIFTAMNDNEALILGHHFDDQIETFFYRLFRGSSPNGLSCMKEISERESRKICRPLLSFSKKTIEKYVKEKKIEFIHDLTNNDTSFDRNYIRKNIIPNVKARWSGFSKVMKHNIMLQNSYKNIANDYCKVIFDHVVSNEQVDINLLKSYPKYLHGIFLRYFMSQTINYELSKNELSSILKLFYSENNDYPKLILKNNLSIIRYNNFFYIIEDKIKINLSEQLWDLNEDISFGDFRLTIKELKDKGIYDCLCKKAPIILRNVKGKERMMLNKHNHQKLKKIFQAKNIPLWERQRFILLFSQNELLVACGAEHTFISTVLR
ncbi:MAG: tRNA lysidine(34) synthetase TilS [Pseudomonadota bacterium]|nr:tRNA lysidine(34) synthetase TilS [Pseudomonadota bacterium]